MINATALHVLRMPAEPNAHYHTDCYTPGSDEIVQWWIQNPDNPPCLICGRGIWDIPPVVQLALFDLEVA